jgi:hypothetical protein
VYQHHGGIGVDHPNKPHSFGCLQHVPVSYLQGMQLLNALSLANVIFTENHRGDISRPRKSFQRREPRMLTNNPGMLFHVAYVYLGKLHVFGEDFVRITHQFEWIYRTEIHAFHQISEKLAI